MRVCAGVVQIDRSGPQNPIQVPGRRLVNGSVLGVAGEGQNTLRGGKVRQGMQAEEGQRPAPRHACDGAR